MARSLRADYPGAWHHVMHRGARRALIFADDEDGILFLDVVADAVRRWGLEVHAYSLMPNHYHLLVRSPSGQLSRAMRHVNGIYTQRFNRRHGYDGPLFRGRFASQLVEDEGYLRYLVAYIHLNPVRANLVQRPDDYAWTSHRALVGLDPAPPWLSIGLVPTLFRSGSDLHNFVREIHLGREEWPPQLELDHGWLVHGGPSDHANHPATDPAALADATAADRVSPEATLHRVAWLTQTSLEDLRTPRRGRHGNPARRLAVLLLARHDELRHRDIGELLQMSPQQVRVTLFEARNQPVREPLATWLRQWDDLEEADQQHGETPE